jgi:hypothetical protein
MNPRNPEHKSNNAILCFCIGAGLATFAYFMGIGGVFVAAFSGGDPFVVAGGILMFVVLSLSAVVGGLLMLIGGIWMIGRVIADQTGDAEEKRYRDVER